MAFVQTWDDAEELEPADTDQVKLGPTDIRGLKVAIRERLQIDHEFATADSGTDTGYHKRVTLKKVAGGASEAASGYAELVYNSTSGFVTVYPEGGSQHSLADLDSTQTFTSKTLTSPTITGATMTTVDINSGAIDGTIIGGVTPAAGNFSTVDINGGSVDGTIIGANSAAAGTFSSLIAATLGAALNANSQAITNINIDSGVVGGITLDGAINAGSQAITNINVDSGAIDGTVIGANSAAAGTFSTLTASSLILGAIDDTAIGSSTPSTGVFTTLTATTLGGALDMNDQALTNVNIDSGTIIALGIYPTVLTASQSIGLVRVSSDTKIRATNLTMTTGDQLGFQSYARRSAGSDVYSHFGHYYNGSGEPCGCITLNSISPSTYYLWVDATGDLRISTTHTHVGTTSGTVVGTQT